MRFWVSSASDPLLTSSFKRHSALVTNCCHWLAANLNLSKVIFALAEQEKYEIPYNGINAFARSKICLIWLLDSLNIENID